MVSDVVLILSLLQAKTIFIQTLEEAGSTREDAGSTLLGAFN